MTLRGVTNLEVITSRLVTPLKVKDKKGDLAKDSHSEKPFLSALECICG